MSSNIIRDGLQAQNQADGQGGFTYNNGDGIKDTVLMTGPLGEIYTKALNVYFEKKDVTEPQEGANEGQSQASEIDKKIAENQPQGDERNVAVESQVMDAAMMDEILRELDQENVDRSMLAKGLKFASGENPQASLNEISTTAFILDLNQAARPEVVEQVQASKAGGRYHTVVVLRMKPSGQTAGIIPTQDTLQINEGNLQATSSQELGDFMLAAEELYVKQGIPVFTGIGHYIRDYQKNNFA